MDWFEYYIEQQGCKLIIINNKSLSPKSEMVQDLMAIIHGFSCRLYGLRQYKKIIKDAVSKNSNSV